MAICISPYFILSLHCKIRQGPLGGPFFYGLQCVTTTWATEKTVAQVVKIVAQVVSRVRATVISVAQPPFQGRNYSAMQG